MNYRELAKEAYTIWRGSARGRLPLGPHWDHLEAWQQESLQSVAAYASEHVVEAIVNAEIETEN